MKKTALVLVLSAFMAASSAQAEVSISVNVGTPPPSPPHRVMVSSPPSIYFEVAPLFIAPSGLGFYVGVDTPYDIIFSSDYFYLYYGNTWHRSSHHNGPWVEVPYRNLPPGIRKHRIEQIRSYRDREYRVYRTDRNHYRGRQFRPDRERDKEKFQDERRRDREWKDDQRRDREWKDEQRRDKEWKDEKRRDKEERKEEKRDRKQYDRGRD